MITKNELKKIAQKKGLHLYQQEKEYLLKLFLYYYYQEFEDAVFKGGTSLRFCHGLDRFSEDLDFNINIEPKVFQEQIKKTLKKINNVGIETFSEEELFENSYTCKVFMHGPLHDGSKQNRNKIRIDAGLRLKTLKDAKWKFINSEYPEIPAKFLVKVMDEEEVLAEKVIAMNTRSKGRDLYDTWFLLEMGLKVNKNLINKKKPLKKYGIVPEEEYVRDLQYLTKRLIPYKQVSETVKKALE